MTHMMMNTDDYDNTPQPGYHNVANSVVMRQSVSSQQCTMILYCMLQRAGGDDSRGSAWDLQHSSWHLSPQQVQSMRTQTEPK